VGAGENGIPGGWESYFQVALAFVLIHISCK
jgi:hypothetical protein